MSPQDIEGAPATAAAEAAAAAADPAGGPSSRFRQFLDVLNVGVLMHDETGRIMLSNRMAREMLDVPENELENRGPVDPAWDVVHEDHTPFPFAEQPVSLTFQSGQPVRNVVMGVWRPRSRDRIWLLVNAEPQLDTEGRVRAVIATFGDITERQRMQEALRQSEERLRSLIEHSADAVILANPVGNILFASHAATRVLGHPPEELIGRIGFEFIYPEDLPEAHRALAACQASGEQVTTSVRIQHPRLGVRTIEVNLISHLDKPLIGAIVINFRDITDRLRLERELQQSQKMETIGRLSGGIAHDFNNLLTAILGYARLLQDQIPANSPQRQAIEEIFRAGERAAALTSQLLAFSRKQTVAPRLVDFDVVLTEMEKLVRRLIGEDVRLDLELGAQGYRVKIDPSQLQQVVLNLVVNAREAMPSGGQVLVSTLANPPRANVGAEVVMTVSDTGVGMNEETRRHLFEPFFTTKERGTGLGLATIATIVETCGGQVTVTSRPNEGASFQLRFPALPATAQETQPIAILRRTRSDGERVLIVEDDASVRTLVERTLEAAGYRVLSACDAAEALSILERDLADFALVLTDVVMPGLSGPDLLDQIRQTRPAIRHLMMSGYAGDALRGRGGRDIPDRVLHKPFTPEALLRAVRGAIDRRDLPLTAT